MRAPESKKKCFWDDLEHAQQLLLVNLTSCALLFISAAPLHSQLAFASKRRGHFSAAMGRVARSAALAFAIQSGCEIYAQPASFMAEERTMEAVLKPPLGLASCAPGCSSIHSPEPCLHSCRVNWIRVSKSSGALQAEL